MPVDGFTPLEPVADAYKTPSNAPHTDMHDAEAAAINLLAAAIPEGFEDLVGFDTSAAGTITGRKLLVFDDVASEIVLGADADPSGAYVPVSALGVATVGGVTGVATLDEDGNVVQDLADPAPGLQVKSNGGTALTARPYFNIVGANSVNDDGSQITVDVTKANVPILRLQPDFSFAANTTLTTIPDLSPNLGHASLEQWWDFDLYLVVYSITAAQFKGVVTFPAGCLPEYDIWGPHTATTSASSTDGAQFDVDKQRITHCITAAPGAQQFGGFTSGGTLTPITVRAAGMVKYPAGVTGQMAVKGAQVNSNAAVTAAKGAFSKLILSQAK